MALFLSICLCIMPWIILPIKGIEDQMRLPQSIFMDFIFFGIITMAVFRGLKYTYKNKYFAVLVGWVFLNFLYFFFCPFGFKTEQGRMLNIWMLEPMIHIILGIFASIAVFTCLDAEDFRKVAKALCISGALVSVVAIMQFFNFDPFGSRVFHRSGNHVAALLDNPNVVANYLCLCFPLYFLFPPAKYRWLTLLCIGGILVTRSNFAIGLLGVSVFAYIVLLFRKNRTVLLLLGLVITSIISAISYTDFGKLSWGGSGRLECWEMAVQHLKDNPLLGQGIGVFKSWYIFIRTSVWLYVHNDWLERAIEIGLVGVFLMVLVVINTIRMFNYDHKENYPFMVMFITFLVMMFGSFPFETSTVALLGVFSWWACEKF